jgi:hypothetical protein
MMDRDWLIREIRPVHAAARRRDDRITDHTRPDLLHRPGDVDRLGRTRQDRSILADAARR